MQKVGIGTFMPCTKSQVTHIDIRKYELSTNFVSFDPILNIPLIFI